MVNGDWVVKHSKDCRKYQIEEKGLGDGEVPRPRRMQSAGLGHRLVFWEARKDWEPHRHLGLELDKGNCNMRPDLHVQSCPSQW